MGNSKSKPEIYEEKVVRKYNYYWEIFDGGLRGPRGPSGPDDRKQWIRWQAEMKKLQSQRDQDRQDRDDKNRLDHLLKQKERLERQDRIKGLEEEIQSRARGSTYHSIPKVLPVKPLDVESATSGWDW